MKFFIGGNNAVSRKHATDWWRQTAVLADLENWARQKELEWGECFLFIEVTLPQSTPKNTRHSVDLMVAFDERAALCEMKRSGPRGLDVADVIHQINSQEEAFENVLRRVGFGTTFARILFLPALGADQLKAVSTQVSDIHNQPHIFVAGADEEFKYRPGRQYHLVDVLNACFTSRTVGRSAGSSKGVQVYLQETLNDGDARRLEMYSTLPETLAALKSFSISPYVTFPHHHVEHARDGEFSAALKVLLDKHVLELCGPPQIGKSVLAGELIRELQCPLYEIKLERTSGTFAQLGRHLEERIEGAPDWSLPEEELPARLATENAVFWIKRYPDGYRTAVGEFLKRFGNIRSDKYAYCIVESSSALDGCGDFRIELGGMSRSKLATILDKLPKGKAAPVPEQVIDDSRGNPGIAIRFWTADTQAEQECGDFGWFDNQVKVGDKRIVSAVCFAMAKTPFGISEQLLQRFVAVACPDLPSGACRDAVSRVLALFADEQLADITTFTAHQFGGLLDEIVPATANLKFVHSIDPRFIAAVKTRMDESRANRWLTALDQVLIEAAEPGNLAGTIYSVACEKDLEPFFRSSFRHTALGSILLQWIEESNWEPEGRQAYLLKALRILAALSRDHVLVVEHELGLPDPKDPVQRFAFEFVKARQMVVQDLPRDFDLAAWRERVDTSGDPDLRSTWYTSCSAAMLEAGRSHEAWQLLRDISAEIPSSTTAGVIIHFQMANFVNTKEGRALVDESEGPGRGSFWTTTCAQALVEGGLRCENVHLIAIGLFYYARAAEFSVGRTEFKEVLSYLAALDWVEHIPGSRARWRMRTLLTRGSIHRHFLRQDGLPWNEFAIHWELAWADYNRAFTSAHRTRHALHALNAVSYTTRLCRAALRYVEVTEAQPVIADYSHKALEQWHLVQRDIKAKGAKEVNIWGNIQKDEPLLTYIAVVCKAGIFVEEHVPAIKEQWARYKGSVVHDRISHNVAAVENALKDVGRAFELAYAVAPDRDRQVFSHIRAEIESLLKATEPRNPNHRRLLRFWKKLLELTSRHDRRSKGAGIT